MASRRRIGKDAETITSLIPAAFTPDLLESLQDNGQYAFTVKKYRPTRPTSSVAATVSHRRSRHRICPPSRASAAVREGIWSCIQISGGTPAQLHPRARDRDPFKVTRSTCRRRVPVRAAGSRRRWRLEWRRSGSRRDPSRARHGVPAIIVTCLEQGIRMRRSSRRCTWVDDTHVALVLPVLQQTVRNVRENRAAAISSTI